MKLESKKNGKTPIKKEQGQLFNFDSFAPRNDLNSEPLKNKSYIIHTKGRPFTVKIF